MARISVGDVVARRSYGCDLDFTVLVLYDEANRSMALLKGLNVRLLATAPVDDLIRVGLTEDASQSRTTGLSRAAARESYFNRYGRVLHLDGDADLLQRSMAYYKKNGIDAVGVSIAEEQQAEALADLLGRHRPELLVITGHDGLVKGKDPQDLASYHHSADFIRSVRVARSLRPDLDDLVIFAGACQSYFEELINAGANFASAPDRVLINDLDPAIVMVGVNHVRVDQLVEMGRLAGETSGGTGGIGGIDTWGKYRKGLPAV